MTNGSKWTHTYHEGPHIDFLNIEEGESANLNVKTHASNFQYIQGWIF